MTTNATPITVTEAELLILTAAAKPLGITTINVNARGPSGTSLAGVTTSWKRASVAGTGGTTLTTVGKAHPDYPTQGATVTFTAATGTTPLAQKTVGAAAPGGAGGWMAIEPNDVISLKAAGGANGNMEVSSIAGIASIVAEVAFDFKETS